MTNLVPSLILILTLPLIALSVVSEVLKLNGFKTQKIINITNIMLIPCLMVNGYIMIAGERLVLRNILLPLAVFVLPIITILIRLRNDDTIIANIAKFIFFICLIPVTYFAWVFLWMSLMFG